MIVSILLFSFLMVHKFDSIVLICIDEGLEFSGSQVWVEAKEEGKEEILTERERQGERERERNQIFL